MIIFTFFNGEKGTKESRVFCSDCLWYKKEHAIYCTNPMVNRDNPEYLVNTEWCYPAVDARAKICGIEGRYWVKAPSPDNTKE